MVLIQIAMLCAGPVNGNPIRINCCWLSILRLCLLATYCNQRPINPPQKLKAREKLMFHCVAILMGHTAALPLSLKCIVIQFVLISAFVLTVNTVSALLFFWEVTFLTTGDMKSVGVNTALKWQQTWFLVIAEPGRGDVSLLIDMTNFNLPLRWAEGEVFGCHMTHFCWLNCWSHYLPQLLLTYL